jgi:uncharacterized protein YbjT (DUF2867 family)
MKINAIIFGASGMVGRGVLLECLESDQVDSVLMVNRYSIGVKHPKLIELIHGDFLNYESIKEGLKGYNACFWTLGISVVGLTEEKYTLITHDYTLAAAKLLVGLNPDMSFCYVSGTGTDSTEKGRTMWARVKGRTENELLALPFKAAFMFRPGYIQPMKGIKSKTGWYNALYVIFKPLYPLMKALAPNTVTNSVHVGMAMIHCVLRQPDIRILHSREINSMAQ